MTTEEERCEGIVLRSFEYKERQRIITLFSREAGLISLIMKGLSRKNTNLLALATPLCRAEYLYLKGRSDLYRFRDGTPVDEHLGLRKKFHTLQAAGQLAQYLLASQLPGKPAPELYALFAAYLARLPLFEDPAPLTASFALKILRHEGILSIEEPHPAFSSTEWNLVCRLLLARKFDELVVTLPPDFSQKIDTYYKDKIKF